MFVDQCGVGARIEQSNDSLILVAIDGKANQRLKRDGARTCDVMSVLDLLIVLELIPVEVVVVWDLGALAVSVFKEGRSFIMKQRMVIPVTPANTAEGLSVPVAVTDSVTGTEAMVAQSPVPHQRVLPLDVHLLELVAGGQRMALATDWAAGIRDRQSCSSLDSG